MIIRRRHTTNFTTIGNVLFNDERLDAIQIGVMAWLLSRPNDWEIRRPALMRRLRIGRDSLRRVLRDLIRLGWIVARMTRLSNGTVHVLYEVRDDPGPELSEDEVKAALSLVSSGAGPGESVDDDGAEDGADQDKGNPPDADPGGGSPYSGQPETVSRLRQGVSGHIEESLKTDSQRKNPPTRARAFSDVREAWPPENIASFVVCESLHANLTEHVKEDAFRGINPYLADCATQSRKVCDLATYYRERRWERFTSKAVASSRSEIKPYTPQWYRWREYRVATGQSVRLMEEQAQAGKSWWERSEWPPALPSETRATATGPPQSLMTEDDHAYMAGKKW